MLPLKEVCQSRALGGVAWSIGNRLFGKLNSGKVLGLPGEKLGAGFDRCSRMLQEYMGFAPIQPPSVRSPAPGCMPCWDSVCGGYSSLFMKITISLGAENTEMIETLDCDIVFKRSDGGKVMDITSRLVDVVVGGFQHVLATNRVVSHV